MASAWSRFATHISMKGGLMIGPIGEEHPFSKMFKKLISEEEAEFGCLVPKKPSSVEELANAFGISEEKAAPMLKHMAQKGVVFERMAGDKPFYNITPFIPGFYEYVMTDPETKKDPEMAELFRDLNHIIPAKIIQFLNPQTGGLLKVTPVMKEVDAQRKVYSFEDVRTFINNGDSFSVADCACRLSAQMVGKGCTHPVQDSCMQIGETADYYVRTGRGRRVSKEEALELLESYEQAGLVHTAFSVEGEDCTSFICNCCGCSCSGLRYTNIFDGHPFASSNFRAQINEDNCVACGNCVEICPVNAVTLGSKLTGNVETQIPDALDSRHNWISNRENKWNYINERNIVANQGTAPCKVACPAHISVQGYLQKAAEGDYLAALELIKRDNPLPAVCGRICSHPCEAACTRGTVDEPLAIDAVKMFIADQELHAESQFIPKKLADRPEKVAIIGSGPAGLTCAYYLAVDGFQVTVFEKEEKLGGMLTLGIPNFRLEKDVVNAEIDVLSKLGVQFRTGVEVGKDMTINDLRHDGYQAFYLAIGAQKGATLGLDGEELPNVINGVDFLRNINLGKDASLTGKVAVIGGGNVAIDVARAAVREGAEEVHMYCLESREEMPANLEEQYEAEQEGIIFHCGWGPKEIFQKDGKACGIQFKKCTSVFDSDHKFAPQYDENVAEDLEVTAILLSIGQRIDWGDLLAGEEVDLLPGNRVKAHEVSFQTKTIDIFAGGDVVTGPRFAIDAIAMGKQGAISISRLLQDRHLLDNRPMGYREINKSTAQVGGYDAIPRQKEAEIDFAKAKKTFEDLRVGLTEEQIRKETKRCLHCGRSVVDIDKCIGCGVCTKRCDFDAIHLVRIADTTPSVNFPVWYGRIATYAAKRLGNIAKTEVSKLRN